MNLGSGFVIGVCLLACMKYNRPKFSLTDPITMKENTFLLNILECVYWQDKLGKFLKSWIQPTSNNAFKIVLIFIFVWYTVFG